MFAIVETYVLLFVIWVLNGVANLENVMQLTMRLEFILKTERFVYVTS